MIAKRSEPKDLFLGSIPTVLYAKKREIFEILAKSMYNIHEPGGGGGGGGVGSS